jgi:uncharacterized protein (DUF2141 family)
MDKTSLNMNSRSRRLVSCCVTALLLVVASFLLAESIEEPKDGPASLTVLVTGIRSDEGKLRFALYRSRETFTDSPMRGTAKDIEDGRATWRLTGLDPGPYALAVYHDENNDDQFNRNFLGVPLEDYGFSNNARPRLRAPSWNRVVFEVKLGTNLHHIRLNTR